MTATHSRPRRRALVAAMASLGALAALAGSPAASAASVASAGSAAGPTGAAATAATTSTATVAGSGLDTDRSYALATSTLPARLHVSATLQTPLCPQAGGTWVGGVVVSHGVLVVEESQYQCAFVSGYDLASGSLLWRNATRFAGAPQLLGSSVVIEAQDGPVGDDWPSVRRLSLATGAEQWRGMVMNGANNLQLGAGSGVVAMDQQVMGASTGRTRFTLSTTENISADTVTRGVVLATDGIVVRAADPATGAPLWSVKAVSMSAPQVHAGKVYVTAVPRTQVIDLASGAALGSVPGSDGSMALLGGRGVGATNIPGENGLVRAFSLSTGRIQWAYRVPAPSSGLRFVSMPVVAGPLVWVTTTAGTDNTLVALDAATGALRSSLILPCQPSTATVVPLSDRLLIPSSCGLLVATP